MWPSPVWVWGHRNIQVTSTIHGCGLQHIPLTTAGPCPSHYIAALFFLAARSWPHPSQQGQMLLYHFSHWIQTPSSTPKLSFIGGVPFHSSQQQHLLSRKLKITFFEPQHSRTMDNQLQQSPLPANRKRSFLSVFRHLQEKAPPGQERIPSLRDFCCP